MSDYKLMVLKPTVQMTALVNQASFSYPLGEVTYDNGSTEHDAGGDFNTVEPEMTVLFGTAEGDDTYGRQRIRSDPDSTTIYIGRSPQGTRDGEVDLVDNAFITVLADLRVWSQIPFIDTSTDPPTIFKDHDLASGSYVKDPPPIANCGAWHAGTVDSGTGVLRVTLPHEANTSFPVADGATISSYSWQLPASASLVAGYATSDSQIEVDQDPGFSLYRLTVTDSIGHSHSAYVGVYAYDPNDAASAAMFVDKFQMTSHNHRQIGGQRLSVKILQDLDEDEFPDGTTVMLWKGEPGSGSDRSHMEFVGWQQTIDTRIVSSQEGLKRETTLHCYDVAGRLGLLHGFPFTITRDTDFSGWYFLDDLNMLQLQHYTMNWHTNALIVADWKPDDTTFATYPMVIYTSSAGNVYDQVHELCQTLVPDYLFTCNRIGQLLTVVDPLLQASGDRTSTVQAAIAEDDWTSLSYETHHWPRYNWVREEAVLADATNMTPLFSLAPGDSPGQGQGTSPKGEQLALSQADLNTSAGQRYGRLNAYLGPMTISLLGSSRRGIDPADAEWVTLDVGAAYAAQRGLTFTTARFLPLELRFAYRHTQEGTIRTVTLVAEQETTGIAGVTDTSRE